VATWIGPNRNGDQVERRPPAWCVQAVLARGRWPGLRELTGVAEAPTFRPDGSDNRRSKENATR
jgi:hypothetical protein